MAADTRHPSAYPGDVEAVQTGRRSRVSWGAILAGFVCALAIQAVLALAGLAWGFGTIDPTEETNPLSGLATGGGVYWTVTSIISLFIGGWIAARLAAVPFTIASVIHGVSVWALATIVMVFMVMSAVGMAAQTAAATARAAASAAMTVGETAAEAVGAVDLPQIPIVQDIRQAARQRDLTAQDIRQELRQMYNQVITEREERRAGAIAGETVRDVLRTPGDFSTDISTGLDKLLGGPEAVLSQDDREELVSAIAERFDISNREAERIVNRWQSRWQQATERVETLMQQAQQQTAEAVGTVANVAANTSIALAIASLLGLLAAAIGAGVGRIGLGSRPRY